MKLTVPSCGGAAGRRTGHPRANRRLSARRPSPAARAKTLQRVLDAKGAKLPKKARAKQARTREFRPPPDCPLTTKALMETFRELDPESLPPKKRARRSDLCVT